MFIRVCDSCKKRIDMNFNVAGFTHSYDLCKSCYNKFTEITDEYEIKSEALSKKQHELTEYIKNKLKELGLEV